MTYDAGIVLGHFLGKRGISSRQKKRLDKSIDLYQNKKVAHIITTGGFGFFNKTDISLAEACKEYLIEKGVPDENIFTVSNSIDTFTDINLSKNFIEENNFHSVIIITSVDHMGRAKRISKDIFDEKYNLDFIVSDYFSGLWTILDCIWHLAGWLKYWIKNFIKLIIK